MDPIQDHVREIYQRVGIDDDLPIAGRQCYDPAMVYEIKPGRPSRVREASPAYVTASSPIAAYTVTMADRGRVVLPSEVRERLRIKKGDRLTLRVAPNGTITLQTAAAFARSLRGVFKHLAPGRSLSDELIAERRIEAAKEERDTQAFLARRRAKARK